MPSVHSFDRLSLVICASFLVSTSAFYVSGNDVKIDNSTNKNVTDDFHINNDNGDFLVNRDDKNSSDGLINLHLNLSTPSDQNERNLEKSAIGSDNITNEPIGRNLSEQFSVKGNIIQFKNENDDNKINETNGQSPQHNLKIKIDAETVFNQKGNEEANTELIIKGNLSDSKLIYNANEASVKRDMKSLDEIKKFTTLNLLPSESTSSTPKMREEEKNDKNGDVNKTDELSPKITKEGLIVQKETQKNNLVDNEKLPVENEDNVFITESGYPYHNQLLSTVQTFQDENSGAYPTEVINDQVFVTTYETMPDLLASLVTARTYDIIIDDAFQSNIPNYQNPTNIKVDLMNHLGVTLLTEKPTAALLEIDEKDVMAQVKTPKVENLLNNHHTTDKDKQNEIKHNISKFIDLSITAFPQPSKVDVENINYFKHNIDDTEIKMSGYFRNFDADQKRVVESETKNYLQSTEDQLKGKTENEFEIGIQTTTDVEKSTKNVLENDKSYNAQKNNETTDSIINKEIEQSYIPKVLINITDVVKNSLHSSFHTNTNIFTNNSESFPITFWNLAQFPKDDHNIFKAEGTETQNMKNFKISIKTNHRHPIEADYKSQLREYDENDGVTSETQILPTVFTVDDSKSSEERKVEVRGNNLYGNEEDNMDVYRKELSNNNEGIENFTFESSKIHTKGASSKQYTKETNRVRKDEGRNLYTVRPSYKRFKKLEVLPLKPFRRDPNDNTWRNQSISSLGIVFKANANVSKPLTVVLKNKTETDFSGMEDKENRTEPDLRERLEKLSELRKAKRKYTTPKYSKEENRLKDVENEEQGVVTTISATTSTAVTPISMLIKTTPIPPSPTTQTPFYFKSTPRPFETVNNIGTQRHVLVAKKVNNQNVVYYDKVDDAIAQNEPSEFIPLTEWELERNIDRTVAQPVLRTSTSRLLAQYYIPAEQSEESHKLFERRLYTSINEATNGVKNRSSNSVGLQVHARGYPEFSTNRELPVSVSVFNRGDDHGTISYKINHASNENIARDSRLVRPNRSSHVSDNVGVVNAILPSRAVRNEEDYDYHDRLHLTDLEKFSFTYNSDRFMADVPVLFDTGVVRVDTKPDWQGKRGYPTANAPVSTSSETRFDSGTDYPPSRQ